jgi:protein-tyrosine-phosphatase
VTEETARTITTVSKDLLRKFIPDFLLKQRNIVQRLGPRAGQIYFGLWLRDVVGARGTSRRLVPPSARTFVFVCYGNIMRSAMAEYLMRRAVREARLEEEVCILSAGLHPNPGREAHPWAQQASADLGTSLADHRAKPLTQEMVQQADCILAMDFQNKAELLTLYPDSCEKVFMLSAYAEGPWQYREIPDPYMRDLEATRFCCFQLQTCVRNLIISTFPASAHSVKENIPKG